MQQRMMEVLVLIVLRQLVLSWGAKILGIDQSNNVTFTMTPIVTGISGVLISLVVVLFQRLIIED